MLIRLIFFVLFSVSLLPKVTMRDYTLGLRSVVFAICICLLIFDKCIKSFKYQKTNLCYFNSLDMTYIACIGLTILSFLFLSQNLKEFHYAFLSVGMFCIFLFARTESFNSQTSTFFKGNFLIYSLAFISFINALIGLYQFCCGKVVIGTFGAESFFGCYLAINVPIIFGIFLAKRKEPKSSSQYSVISNRIWIAFIFTSLYKRA